jgi:hypothetical protein
LEQVKGTQLDPDFVGIFKEVIHNYLMRAKEPGNDAKP